MKTRREFFKSAAALGVVGAAGLSLPMRADAPINGHATGDERAYWVSITEKIGRPVLEHLARRELKAQMPARARGTIRFHRQPLSVFRRPATVGPAAGR